MTEKSKTTTKPWFSRLLRHPARKRSGSILGRNTHTHIYLLTYFLRTHTGQTFHTNNLLLLLNAPMMTVTR